MSNLSNGHLERRVKGEFKTRCKAANARCVHCRKRIDYDAPKNTPDAFEVDHKFPVKTHPHLGYDMDNFLASCHKCNRARGDKPYDPDAGWVQANWG